MSELETCLAPVEAPDCLWARVEAAIEPRPARRVAPSFLAAGLLVVMGIGAFGYLRHDSTSHASGTPIDRNSQHSCFACHS